MSKENDKESCLCNNTLQNNCCLCSFCLDCKKWKVVNNCSHHSISDTFTYIPSLYTTDEWLELHDLINRMTDDIEEKDRFEIEGDDLRKIVEAYDFIKEVLHIKTGETRSKSPMTGEWYIVNIWQDKGDGLITALSKRKADEYCENENICDGCKKDIHCLLSDLDCTCEECP